MLIRMLALCLLAPLVLLAACGDDDDAKTNGPAPSGAATAKPGSDVPAKDVTINAADFAFNPDEITAAPGQTINITLVNGDSATHSFTLGTADIVEAEGGEQAAGEFTATQQATEFHCKYHPTQMTGTITVTASGASNPSATAASGGISGIGY